MYKKAEIERVKGQVKEQARKENKTLSKLVQQFYELNASEVQSIDRKKELLKLAGETGLIENPIQNELDEIQAWDWNLQTNFRLSDPFTNPFYKELRVKLAKYDMRLNMASETAEAKTNCTICEEIVS